MSSVNAKTISASVTSFTTAINLGHTLTAGDSNAYTLEITFTDVTAISGTCQLHFTLPDGTYADRDDSDGVTIVGNKVTYLLPEEVYSQRGMICYVQFLNSNLYTPLKVTFSGIRTVPGTTPLVITQSYPTWAGDVITDIAEMSDGNTGGANQVWTSDGAGDAVWQDVAGAGLGDVTGPAGAVAGNLAALDASGKVISDSGSKPADFAAASHTQAANAQVGSAGYPATAIGAYAFAGCAATGTLTVYTADGNPLANAPYGWTGTVTHVQA